MIEYNKLITDIFSMKMDSFELFLFIILKVKSDCNAFWVLALKTRYCIMYYIESEGLQ